jgi:hypothetical protein
MSLSPIQCTAFQGQRRVVAGSLTSVAVEIKRRKTSGLLAEGILIFDDATGRVVDVDLRGTRQEIEERLSVPETLSPIVSEVRENEPARGRGRPRLGVIPREVTLLPRHWEWLNAQQGGASVALRKLVEMARRADHQTSSQRKRQEAAFHFMTAMGGDLPNYEESIRALYADNQILFEKLIADWPMDIRTYAAQLAFEVADTESI